MTRWTGWVHAALVGAALAATAAAGAAQGASALPPEVGTALQRAGVPEDALSVVVQELGPAGRVLLSWQAEKPQNPASLAKLLVTTAALERLGPAFTWSTPVWLAGSLRDGALEGSLHIKGQGDPKLVVERVWLLLRRVRELGVREIRGDIVLDQSAFAVPEVWAGDFDGEPLRPYNVKPAALLFNYRSVVYTFWPDAGAGVARIGTEVPLAQLNVERTVPLASGPCDDWRGALKASVGPDGALRFAGHYPVSCGEQAWPLADPQPASYEARLIEGLWREMGGTLTGRVRFGPAPLDLKPSFELRSPALSEIVRDINKFSNNVMAEQLFLTLALQAAPAQPATPDAARAVLARWLGEKLGERANERPAAKPVADGPDAAAPEVVLANGSGLSRQMRLSARVLARLLWLTGSSPVMPELMSSLPISAVDGTLRRARAAAGRAHLKTGSLRDTAGVAGYVLTPGGRRMVLVAMINHPQAPAARPALEALIQWTAAAVPGASPAPSVAASPPASSSTSGSTPHAPPRPARARRGPRP